MCVFYVYRHFAFTRVCIPKVPGALGGQKRTLIPLKLELQPDVGVLGSSAKQQVLLTT